MAGKRMEIVIVGLLLCSVWVGGVMAAWGALAWRGGDRADGRTAGWDQNSQ